ncbi:MAG: alpha/beta fold hydrolase, partial [Acholeplasmataceae bacterium]|nr:alpha/beta fold hydrolase [Acholeplasmataceae bacterium]
FLDFFSSHGFDCYALSLRGHGKSDGHALIHTWGLDDYVNDVKSVVDQMKEKPILIGHSMGGAITQKYLGLHHKDLHKVVLFSSAKAGGIDPNSPLGFFFKDMMHYLRTLRSTGSTMNLEEIMQESIFSNNLSLGEVRIIRKKLVVESSKVKKELLKPFLNNYEEIDIPILVFGSSKDRVITKHELEITAKAFGVEPVIIDGLCHFATLDPNWEVAAKCILEFLET